MAGDRLYRSLSRTLDVTVWGGELVTEIELPLAGPAVFVANHAGAMGPIGIAASLPVRLYPWVVGDMMDPEKAGPWLQKDFAMGELHLPEKIAAPVSNALSRVTVPLLRNLGCIPVWHDRDLLETYRISDEHLAAGQSLLIFPEDPEQPISSRTGMRPFKTGFAHLGWLHAARTKQALRFFPVAVHRTARKVQVAEPVLYNATNAEAAERRRVAHLIESIIASMLSGGAEPLGALVGRAKT